MTLAQRIRRWFSGTSQESSRKEPDVTPIDPRNENYDRWMEEIMRKVVTPTSNCIDIGANRGVVLEKIVSIAPRGTHHAFEPLPALAASLRERFPNVHVHEMALSDSNGKSTFRHVIDIPEYSGFKRRPWDTYEEKVDLIEVTVSRLDDIIPEDHTVHFMKVDVEGAEISLFRGALRTISKQKPYLAFEIGFDPAIAYGLLVDEAGLKISRLDDWLAGRPPLDRVAFIDELKASRNYFFLAHPVG